MGKSDALDVFAICSPFETEHRLIHFSRQALICFFCCEFRPVEMLPHFN